MQYVDPFSPPFIGIILTRVCHGYHDKIKKIRHFINSVFSKHKKESTAKAVNPCQSGVSYKLTIYVRLLGGPDSWRSIITKTAK